MKERKELHRIADALEASQRTVRGRNTASEVRIVKSRRPMLYRARVALFTSERKSLRSTRQRMMFPIMGFVGPNGGGKTACAVEMAQEALRQDRKVLSTVPLLDPVTGRPHRLYVPWVDWGQLLGWRDGDVLADEIAAIASSRESGSLDVRAQTLLMQLRKVNVRFWWTAPSYSRADKIIREVTQAITECRGFYSDPRAAQERAGVIQSWAPKRLFSFKTYDATEFEEWTAGKAEKAAPMVTEWFHGPGSTVFQGYDTLGAVNVIAGISDAGVCENCLGIVSAKPKACRCRTPQIAAPLDLLARHEAEHTEYVVRLEESDRHGLGDLVIERDSAEYVFESGDTEKALLSQGLRDQ